MKVGTCARDRHVLQQLALNVHVKHSDQIDLVHGLQQLALNVHVKHSDLTCCFVIALILSCSPEK